VESLLILSDKFEENPSLFLYKSCDELKQNFLDLKTTRDIASLLEVSYECLVYHLYRVPKERKYAEFSIQKKSGGTRTISAPATALKILQRKLSQVLYCIYDHKKPVHGFVVTRSIVTNAKQHLHRRFVLNIDLQDFFGSIHFGRVKGIFTSPPYKCSEEVAIFLAQICCHDGKLPQGAPTSPIVSNMICVRMDKELRDLAFEFKCTYTRYADDITFSTNLSNFPEAIASIHPEHPEIIVLGERLLSLIQSNGFQINDRKIRLQHKSKHQEVTGLTVNQFPNVKRSYVREISSMLHAWDKFGLESAQKRYMEKRSKELQIPESKVPPLRKVLRGKINFLGMVKGKDDNIYRKYLAWYRNLSRRTL
jgi:RNA-directed DNA polymerase